MPRTTRTFIAIGVPDDRAARLGHLQTRLAPEVPGARWVDPKQFHATLAFLGDVDDTDLNDVCRAVADASASTGRLDLNLEGLGAFPNPSRPRTLWVGLTGPGVEELGRLQQAIVRAVGERGYPSEEERFTPHITLARIKSGRGPAPDLARLIERHRAWSAGPFVATQVVTFGSILTPEGPAYTPLARAPLKGRKDQASP